VQSDIHGGFPASQSAPVSRSGRRPGYTVIVNDRQGSLLQWLQRFRLATVKLECHTGLAYSTTGHRGISISRY